MREQESHYEDQFEYLADCFDLIRKRGDALNIRSEALESERMVRYSERSGFESERSHLLEIYRGIEADIDRREAEIRSRRDATPGSFPLEIFAESLGLAPEEVQILLVLLYNESVGRNQTRFQTGNELLNLVFPNPVSALKASRHLDPAGTLLREGLIRTLPDDDAGNFLRASYEVTERTLQEVLGVRDRADAFVRRAAVRTADGPFRTLTPRVSLDAVVLPDDFRERLEEVLWQVERGDRLFAEWGLDRVLEKGRGSIVLFGGPPGTGKTMTAEAMAHRLGRPLIIADYSRIESKWIGETEKNIVGLFREATDSGAVLLVDEADAILAARLDGGHYNDRAYNRQVSLLLTELEAFEGVCILTTNREVSLDEGLARRITARFTFPVPDAALRRRLWTALLPEELPLAEDVDLDDLARKHALPGGNIRNAVLAAVRRAARRDGAAARVRQADLDEAAGAEIRSFGKRAKGIGFREGPEGAFA